MKKEELLKRALILNSIELAFNERQDTYGLEIEQVNENDNLFTATLFNAETLETIAEREGRYGDIKRYVLSLPILKAVSVDGESIRAWNII